MVRAAVRNLLSRWSRKRRRVREVDAVAAKWRKPGPAASDMPEETYLHLIGQLDDLIALLEDHPDPKTKDRVFMLLTGIDSLHREGLRRLVNALERNGGEAILADVYEDPVVKTFLGLYDLAPLDLPEESIPKQDAAFVPLSDILVRPERSGE